jgi:hypothetical protein
VAGAEHVAGQRLTAADEQGYRRSDHCGDRREDLVDGLLEAENRAGPIGFFGDAPEMAEDAGDQLALLLVLLRDKGISRRQLRSFAALSGNSRRMILDMTDSAARIEQHSASE